MAFFEYLDKDIFSSLSREIFTVLANNMDRIAPTGCSREEDYACWYSTVGEGLKKEARQMILIREHEGGGLIGFFQYYANEQSGIFMMEEAQIIPEFWGRGGIFRSLYEFVLSQLPSGITHVEAYADKRNSRSIGILGHLGLSSVGENRRGDALHFRGDISALNSWLHGI